MKSSEDIFNEIKETVEHVDKLQVSNVSQEDVQRYFILQPNGKLGYINNAIDWNAAANYCEQQDIDYIWLFNEETAEEWFLYLQNRVQ